MRGLLKRRFVYNPYFMCIGPAKTPASSCATVKLVPLHLCMSSDKVRLGLIWALSLAFVDYIISFIMILCCHLL